MTSDAVDRLSMDRVALPLTSRSSGQSPQAEDRSRSFAAKAFISIVCFAAGGLVAILDRHGLPVFTANLLPLAALMALGILSGSAGLSALFGFIVTDAFRQFRGDFGELSMGYGGAVIVSWIFLQLLIVGVPQASQIFERMKGRLRHFGGLLCALCVGGLVELWTRLSMVALRPMFIWRGEEMDLQLVEFIDYEWAVAGYAFHQLAWIALGVGLARWVLTSIWPVFQDTAENRTLNALASSRSKLPWQIAAFGQSASFTAVIAGIFTTFVGAGLFCLSIFGALAVRAFASGYGTVQRWDRWMMRIPAWIRLVATYALTFYLGIFLVEILRDTFGWRTMTVAAVGSFLVFAASLPFWPQIIEGGQATALRALPPKLTSGASRAISAGLVILMMFSSTAAFAHHCSFGPGCECLTDERALAALIAAGATIGVFALDQTWVGVGRGLHDAVRGVDLLTGQRLSFFDRVLAGIGAVPILGIPADALRAARTSTRSLKWFEDGAISRKLIARQKPVASFCAVKHGSAGTRSTDLHMGFLTENRVTQEKAVVNVSDCGVVVTAQFFKKGFGGEKPPEMRVRTAQSPVDLNTNVYRVEMTIRDVTAKKARQALEIQQIKSAAASASQQFERKAANPEGPAFRP